MPELHEGTPAQAGMDPARIELIRERAAQWVDQPSTQGLVLLVARHGVVCLHEAWGSLTYRADSPPIGTDALFHCGSLAKPVTATAAMILAEDGLLGLTRPVNYYVPELAGAGTQDMLVQHLLTHTAGYDGENLGDALLAWLSVPRTFPDCPATQDPHIHRLLQALFVQDLAHPPGSLMSYSSHGYELLGEVVRRVSEVSFQDFVAQRIFAPLGMGDSNFGLRSVQRNRFAERDADNPVIAEFGGREDYRRFVEVPFAMGGLFATAADYAIFAQTYLNGGHYGSQRILGEACVAQMTRNQIPGIPAEMLGPHPEGDWGYGFSIISDNRWRMFDGSLPPNGGFLHGGLGGTGFWVDPLNDLIGIYFSVCGIDDVREEHVWEFDLFQNLVTAAIADEA